MLLGLARSRGTSIPPSQYIQLNKRHAGQHQLRIGVTGAGKSSLTHQDLFYSASNEIPCVVWDPEREYIKTHHKASRGDWIIDPTLDDGAGWAIEREADSEGGFFEVWNAVFPPPINNKDETAKIFHQWVTQAMSFLSNQFRPTTAEIARWMIDPREMFVRLRGTELQYIVNQNAANSKAGIISTLNTAGLTFRMMPDPQTTKRMFSVREYVRNPNGAWVFITGSATVERSLNRIDSALLDLCILNALEMGEGRRLNIVIDEADTLQHLPTMAKALTRGRKRGLEIILGFQSVEQTQRNYGDQWKTILGMCRNAWVFRCDSDTAEFVENRLGKGLFLRIRENHSDGTPWFNSKHGRTNRSIEVVETHPVKAFDLMGLDDLSGYFIQGGINRSVVAVPFAVPHVGDLVKDGSILTPRELPQRDDLPPLMTVEEFEQEQEKAKQKASGRPVAPPQPKDKNEPPPVDADIPLPPDPPELLGVAGPAQAPLRNPVLPSFWDGK